MNNSSVYNFIRVYSAMVDLCATAAVFVLTKTRVASSWNVAQRAGLPILREPIGDRSVTWIHAASMGEAKLAMKFLRLLQKKRHSDAYVLTATTRSGVNYLHAHAAAGVVATGFLPFDSLRRMRALLNAFKVRRVWLMETEIWPAMMASCLRSGVAVGIVNGRMEEKSFAVYRRFKALCAPLFETLDIVLAQNELYASRFRSMGSRPEAIHIVGNLKSLVDITAPSSAKRRMLRTSLCIGDADFVLTAGCIHAGEGKALKETLTALKQAGRKVKCIVVPRYLHETASLLNALGPDIAHVHEIAISHDWDTCLIDKMGILDDMYKAADAAFIGGTFVAVGGHSIWDAAQFALPVFFGPDYHTQRDSFNMLMCAGVAFSAASPGELALRIASIMNGNREFLTQAYAGLMESSRKQIDHIEGLLP